MTFIGGKVGAYLDRISGWNRGETPSPATVEFDLSNRCTLGCQSCHFAHTHVRGPWASQPRRLPMAFDSTGDLAAVGMVERVLSEFSSSGVRGIIWSGGGEPTTHPDWQRIVAFASKRGLEQGMYTHGGLLTREGAAFLAGHATWVVVSLDACDAETYAAEKGVPLQRFVDACNGASWLAEAKRATVGISFLLHAKNWQDVPRMYALAKSLRASYVTFRPAVQTDPRRPSVPTDERGWIHDALPTLRAFAQRADVECDPERFIAYRDWVGHGYDSCRGPQLNTTVTPDGRVWACPQKRGLASGFLGDLRAEFFGDIWARHPGRFAVDAECRAMCRLHPINQTLDALTPNMQHEAFV